MLIWKVYIYDKESGCEQPITVQGGSKADATRLGNKYMRDWNLKGACITKIEKEEVAV